MRQKVIEAYERNGGNTSAAARELGIPRSTAQYHVSEAGLNKAKPLTGGSLLGVSTLPAELPPAGQVKVYIVTSAQNNTKLNERVWASLLALAEHYEAEILVGTYSYNKNAFGKMSVKRGTASHDTTLWYDKRIEPYTSDVRRELANGLVWCGEMNIQPTAEDPLSGLETYSSRDSAIFPHAKMALRSIAAMAGAGVKFNYTTGTVTQRNYIQKKAGLKGEHHHIYGALIVEVNSKGNWWVRQLDADDKGRIQDLTVLADGDKVTTNNRVEAITWGDLHATTIDVAVLNTALGDGGMLDSLRPRYQFVHDLLEGVSINHHAAKDPHEQFKAFLRGFDSVEAELRCTANTLGAFTRKGVTTVVVDSNHDNWLSKWLKEHDYRRDPRNAMLFLEAQLATFTALQNGNKRFNITEWAILHDRVKKATHRQLGEVKFLLTDDSFTICDGRIECGMHGHLGPNGSRGTPANLNKVGRRANTGHTHAATILNGLYVAGTSTTLNMGYNRGPSSWSHSHIVTYPNGKRSIVTIFAGQWRA
jgi:hypothetical protein